eukprot:SAG31_NODE_1079_length_10031_cov_5.270741_5_plen_115_part_00
MCSFVCPLLEKYGNFIAICNALIEKVSTFIGAPHDLTAPERQRFAEMVLRGARTIRLALGLFLRGLGAQNKSIVGRWPSQMAELRQLAEISGIEGWAVSKKQNNLTSVDLFLSL